MKLKYSIATAITLVVLAALGSCNNPFAPPPSPKTTEGRLAKGEGGILLSLDGLDIQRTILPATVLDDFVKFDLAFKSGDRNESYSGTRSELSSPLTLPAGMTWDLTATGYISDGSGGYLVAATGSETGIVIAPNETTPVNITLKAISDEGEGTLSYTLNYPDTTVSATMTITPLSVGATLAQTLDFTADLSPAAPSGVLTLSSGYYRVTMSLTDGEGRTAGTRDILHVYKNLSSAVSYAFTPADFSWFFRVSSGADSGPGTLRQALEDAESGDTIEIDEGLVITLTSELFFDRAIRLTIEGYGATLTQTGTNRLLHISHSNADVVIRRLHFKDGGYTLPSTSSGAAIYNHGALILESCIFSGNRATSTSSDALGGAIFNDSFLTLRGCTFYNNDAVGAGSNAWGGALYNSGALSLTGNVFYGNSATYGAVAYQNSGSVSSGGHNVSDQDSGLSSGWIFAPTDVRANTMPVGPVSFKPRSGLAAAGRITERPEHYPTLDFYGKPIPVSEAHAGAVQELTSGHSLDLKMAGQGSINVISGTADVDNFYVSGSSVKLRAVPDGGRIFRYWKVDGAIQPGQTPATEITLVMDRDKTVEAYFVGLYAATKADFSGSNTATVSFPGLAGNSVFLVRVNKGDANVAAANSGGVFGAAGLPLTNLAPSFAPFSNAAAPDFEHLFPDHPGAMEFNANPPPITAEMRREARNIPRLAALPPPPAVGDKKMFWVETSFDSGTFTQQQATLCATGAYGNVWVMDSAYSAADGGTSDLKITTAQADALAQKFDLIYPVETKLLGHEYGGGVPDTDSTYGGKDGDLKIQILVYDFMGGAGGSSGAAGFFWSKDFYTDVQMGDRYKSNLAEIFYLSVASVESSPEYMYSALVHEFQHMINFNQKYVIKSQSSPSWYNEMLSLMAEDVISPLIGIGPDNSDHPIKTYTGTFLNTYNTQGIAEWATLSHASYAKGFAFGAYLMRNWGGAELLGKILANNSVGIPSITAALNEIEPGMTFEKAVQRYGEALIFSGTAKSADVLSFDHTVNYTLSGTTYTASAFDIWTMGGPKLFSLTDTSELKAYGLIVQTADAWKNKTGDLTITLNKPVSPNVELYVMVR
jgi:hypothetical protein